MLADGFLDEVRALHALPFNDLVHYVVVQCLCMSPGCAHQLRRCEDGAGFLYRALVEWERVLGRRRHPFEVHAPQVGASDAG